MTTLSAPKRAKKEFSIELPWVLWVHTFSYLETSEISSARGVNRLFNDTICDQAQAQAIFERSSFSYLFTMPFSSGKSEAEYLMHELRTRKVNALLIALLRKFKIQHPDAKDPKASREGSTSVGLIPFCSKKFHHLDFSDAKVTKLSKEEGAHPLVRKELFEKRFKDFITQLSQAYADKSDFYSRITSMDLSKCQGDILQTSCLLPSAGAPAPFANVTSLSLQNCGLLNRDLFYIPRVFPNLQHLDISETYVDNDGLRLLVKEKRSQLISIDLSGLSKISCTGVEILATRSPQLQVINLTHCSKKVTQTTIQWLKAQNIKVISER